MPHELNAERAVLIGDVTIEEAEPLLEWLCTRSGPVNLSGCTSMHMAVLQLLAKAAPEIEEASSSNWQSLLTKPHTFQPNH